MTPQQQDNRTFPFALLQGFFPWAEVSLRGFGSFPAPAGGSPRLKEKSQDPRLRAGWKFKKRLVDERHLREGFLGRSPALPADRQLFPGTLAPGWSWLSHHGGRAAEDPLDSWRRIRGRSHKDIKIRGQDQRKKWKEPEERRPQKVQLLQTRRRPDKQDKKTRKQARDCDNQTDGHWGSCSFRGRGLKALARDWGPHCGRN